MRTRLTRSALFLCACSLMGACSSVRWQDVAANWVANSCRSAQSCRLSCPDADTPNHTMPPVCRREITHGVREVGPQRR